MATLSQARVPAQPLSARSERNSGSSHRSGDSSFADWWQESTDGYGGPKLLSAFDGGHLSAHQCERIVVDGVEVTAFNFCSVSDLASVTIPRLANRIEHALAAHRDGTMRYLEDGSNARP